MPFVRQVIKPVHKKKEQCVCGVYQIRHIGSGKIYIGSSTQIERRLSHHNFVLSKGTHVNKELQFLFNLDPKVEYSILELTKESQLFIREQHFMDKVPKELLLNVQPLAGTPKGSKHTEETKSKISVKAKEVGNTPEQKKMRSERAKLQHAKGWRRGQRSLRMKTCKECKGGFIPERFSNGQIKQSKYCPQCRPIQNGGYYKIQKPS